MKFELNFFYANEASHFFKNKLDAAYWKKFDAISEVFFFLLFLKRTSICKKFVDLSRMNQGEFPWYNRVLGEIKKNKWSRCSLCKQNNGWQTFQAWLGH